MVAERAVERALVATVTVEAAMATVASVVATASRVAALAAEETAHSNAHKYSYAFLCTPPLARQEWN